MDTRYLPIDPDAFEAAELAPVVECLERGQVVALPTETVYGLAVRRDLPEARALLDRTKDQDPGKPVTVALSDPSRAEGVATLAPVGLRRLARRFWPGPLTLVAPRRGGQGTVGLRVPAHKVARAVLERFPQGLLLTSANRAGQPAATDAAAVREVFDGRVAAIVDAGPALLGEASAVVSMDGHRPVLHRTNLISADMILQTAATHVLLVCSGNTCRSPMAEALFRQRWAAAWGLAPERLQEGGGRVSSAGTGAVPGITATLEAREAMREAGLDLGEHRSQGLSRTLLMSAHRVFAMTSAHREELRRLWPEGADRFALLEPGGADVHDPFGGDVGIYRRCRDQLKSAVEVRVKELIEDLEQDRIPD